MGKETSSNYSRGSWHSLSQPHKDFHFSKLEKIAKTIIIERCNLVDGKFGFEDILEKRGGGVIYLHSIIVKNFYQDLSNVKPDEQRQNPYLRFQYNLLFQTFDYET